MSWIAPERIQTIFRCWVGGQGVKGHSKEVNLQTITVDYFWSTAKPAALPDKVRTAYNVEKYNQKTKHCWNPRRLESFTSGQMTTLGFHSEWSRRWRLWLLNWNICKLPFTSCLTQSGKRKGLIWNKVLEGGMGQNFLTANRVSQDYYITAEEWLAGKTTEMKQQ